MTDGSFFQRALPTNHQEGDPPIQSDNVPRLSTKKRFMTRRTVLIGLGALTVAAGAGGAIWWARTPHPSVLYRGHSRTITGMAWSPDSKRVASSSFDGTVQVWDAADGGHLLTYHAPLAPNAAAGPMIVDGVVWSPNGKYIAASFFNGIIQVWNAADGHLVHIYQGDSDNVKDEQSPDLTTIWRVAWSPDSERIASISDDGIVRVWNVADEQHLLLEHGPVPSGIFSVAWLPTGIRVAESVRDGTVQIWDSFTGKYLFTYQGHTNFRNLNAQDWRPSPPLDSSGAFAVAWSPTGDRIASAGNDGTVQVWDAITGDHVFIYRGHPVSSGNIFGDPGGFPTDVAWSSDSKWIASLGDNMQIWKAATGRQVETCSGSGGPMVWSPDGKHIATTSAQAQDYTVQIWEIRV